MRTCNRCGTTKSSVRKDTGNEMWFKDPSDNTKLVCHRCLPPWNKGKTGIYSEEYRRAISESKKGNKYNLGTKWNEETRLKAGLMKKGKPTKKRGRKYPHLQGTNSSHFGRKRSAETKERLRRSHLGQKAWNKGITGERSHSYGKEFSVETRAILSSQKQGKKNPQFGKTSWNKGLKFSEEIRAKFRERAISRSYINKDNQLEIKVQDSLKAAGIGFKTHATIIGRPDIFIHPNLCVFLDGDYWHCNPMMFDSDYVMRGGKVAKNIWDKDRRINEVLSSKGYKVLRFWESELNVNLSGFIKKIKEYLK